MWTSERSFSYYLIVFVMPAILCILSLLDFLQNSYLAVLLIFFVQALFFLNLGFLSLGSCVLQQLLFLKLFYVFLSFHFIKVYCISILIFSSIATFFSIFSSPFRNSTASFKFSIPYISKSFNIDASFIFPFGKITFILFLIF